MGKAVYCRYCKYKQEMELETERYIVNETGEKYTAYWYECPLCGSRSPVSGQKEGALEYAMNGYA